MMTHNVYFVQEKLSQTKVTWQQSTVQCTRNTYVYKRVQIHRRKGAKSKSTGMFRWTIVPDDDRNPNILVGAESTKCSGGQLFLKMTATPISLWVQRLQSVQVDSCTWRWPLPQYPHGCREYKVFRWTAVPEDDHYPNILVGAKNTKCSGEQ